MAGPRPFNSAGPQGTSVCGAQQPGAAPRDQKNCPASTQPDLTGCQFKGKLKVKKHKGVHQAPEPSPGQALVYVISQKLPKGAKILAAQIGFRGFLISVNGELTGQSIPGTHFYFEAKPGLLRICLRMADSALNPWPLYLTAEAGKTYYLLTFPFRKREGEGRGIAEIDQAEARGFLGSSTLVTFERKK